MAGELASAVALQSQPYNRPQSTGVSEAVLDNAFNGRRRADEERKRKEDAEKDKRLDSIMKNSVFTKQYENDYFNRQYQQQITKAMDEVLQAYESGDENVGVVGARAVNKLQQIHQTLYSADKSMSAAQKAYDKDPNSLGIYNDQQTIGGKPFSNVFQAINSGDNDLLMPNVAEQYWSTGTEIMERDIAGEKIWIPQFVPGGAVTTDPFSLIEKDVNNPDNATWLNPQPEIFKLGGTTVQSHKFQIDPAVSAKLAAQGMSTPESINYILDQDYRYRKQAAEKNGMTWTRKEQASLTPKENAETIKRYAEELTSKIHGRVGRRERIQDSPPAPKAAAPSDFEKVFTVSATPAYIGAEDENGKSTGYNVIPYTARPGKTLGKVNVDFPKGHYEVVSGKIKKKDKPNSIPAVPKGPAWLDGKLGFMYTNDSETYFNPLDQGSYQMWLQHTGAPEEDVMKEITLVGGGSKQAEAQAKSWMDKMGLQGTTPSGQQKSPSTAPASGTINLQDLPVGAKIEVKNGKNYYNGKEIVM